MFPAKLFSASSCSALSVLGSPQRHFSQMNDFISGFMSEFAKNAKKSASGSGSDSAPSSPASSSRSDPSPASNPFASLMGSLMNNVHLPHLRSPQHPPLGANIGKPQLGDALKALVAPSEEASKALLDQELDFDGFLRQMRRAVEVAARFKDQLHRFIPGADIGQGVDMLERPLRRVLEVADVLTQEEKDRVTAGTITPEDVHRIARRGNESPTVVLQLVGTFDGFLALKREMRERVVRGERVHGLSVSEAMEIVQKSTRESVLRMQELGRRVMETPPPPSK